MKNGNEQFEKIGNLTVEFTQPGNPIISIDTKKKEWLDDFYRDGRLYMQEVFETLDHNFNSMTDGVVIPHSVYDVQRNRGYINFGTGKDTSEFVCDSVLWW